MYVFAVSIIGWVTYKWKKFDFCLIRPLGRSFAKRYLKNECYSFRDILETSLRHFSASLTLSKLMDIQRGDVIKVNKFVRHNTGLVLENSFYLQVPKQYQSFQINSLSNIYE